MKDQADHVTVMLTGASSQLGVFLIPRLLAEGFRVIALSRRVATRSFSDGSNLSWLHPDVLSKNPDQDTRDLLNHIEMLISCGPLDVACAAVSGCPALSRVVVFSTTSVFSKAASPERTESEQIGNILEQEAAVKHRCQNRNLALLIIRPTLIYGCGLDRNISLLASFIQRYRWLPLAGAATGLRQPVHADDLAQAAVAALTADQALVLDSPACGGSTLSYRQMVELIFDSLSLPRRVVRIPTWMLVAAVALLSRLEAFKGLNPQMVYRQNSDLVFDDSPLRKELNYAPRAFRPAAADFQIPASAKKSRAPLRL